MKIKKIFTAAIAGLMLVPAVAFGALAVTNDNVSAQNNWNLTRSTNPDVSRGQGQPRQLDGDTGVIRLVINILLFIIGVISVIMLIIGGLRYATSGGNSGSVESAKNTILYAIIGLIVAIFAYAIINFVVGAFSRT